MEYLVFLVTFFYLSNWFQVNTFAKQLFREKGKFKELKDKQIFDDVFRKTGLKLRSIKLFEFETPFGMMPGVPWRADMILSTNLYKTFSKDELEYVIMHEVGHCVLYHVPKLILVFLSFVCVGLYVLSFIDENRLFYSLISAIILSLLYVQVAGFTEREAENFAASKMDNPEGMISAVREKFSKYYLNVPFFFIKKTLLGHNISYTEKIAIAEKEIERRKLRNG